MFNKKIIIPSAVIAVLLALLMAVTMIGDNTPDTEVNSDSGNEDYSVDYVLDFDTSSAQKVSVKLSAEAFTFTKNGDKWVYAENPNASISTSSVNSLISSVNSIAYDEIIDDGSITADDCGITNGNKLTLVSDTGEVTLSSGMTTTDGKFTYVMTSLSDGVYLAYAEDVSRVFAPLSNYRNSASLSIDFDSVTDIVYSGNEKFTLKKGDADKDNAVYNQWKITSPLNLGANDEAIGKKIIEPLKTIKVTDFASDNGEYSSYGLGSKERYISLTDSYGKTQTVYFSKELAGKYYISIDSQLAIYEITAGAAPYISLKTIELADRNITLAKMTNINTVSLKGDSCDYTVEFASDHGKINGSKISYDVLNQQIFPALCGLMADDIYGGTISGASLTMTFSYKDSTSDTIVFANHNDRYYAVSKNGTVKYLILKSKLGDLMETLGKHK